jgi:hypothetical protein
MKRTVIERIPVPLPVTAPARHSAGACFQQPRCPGLKSPQAWGQRVPVCWFLLPCAHGYEGPLGSAARPCGLLEGSDGFFGPPASGRRGLSLLLLLLMA